MSEKRKSKFKIRQTYDVEAVRRMHNECFPVDDWYETDNLPIYWLVYDYDNTVVGFSILTLMEDDTAFLSRSGVLVNARGNGLQLRLIRARERYARKMAYTKLITYTKIDNIASSVNLQKSGYKLYLPDYAFADQDCLYWIKQY